MPEAKGRDQRRGLLTGAVACALAVATSGCSFMFADGPPANHRQSRYFDCESSYVYPAMDATITVAGIGGFVAALVVPSGAANGPVAGPGGAPAPMPPPPGPSRTSQVVTSIPLLVVPLVSAVYGYTKAKGCGEAKKELGLRLDAAPLAPAPLAPPPGGP